MDYIIVLLNYLTKNDDFNDKSESKNDDDDDDIRDIMYNDRDTSDIGNVYNQNHLFVKQVIIDSNIYREHCTLIQFLIQRLTLLNKSDDAASKIPFLFNGVQLRFNSDIIEIRYLGMIVAHQ